MAWAFGSAGAMAAASGTDTTPLNVPYPAGIAAGDLLLLLARYTTSNRPTISDITTQIGARDSNPALFLYGKIATGSESGNVTIQMPSGTTSWVIAQIARFTGGPSSLTGIVHASSNSGSGAALGLPYPALDGTTTEITENNTLVILAGGKSVNASGFAVPAAMDAEIGEGTGSTVQSLVWDYDIQTTATNLSAGSWTIDSDGSGARTALAVSLLPSSTAKYLKLLAHSSAAGATGVNGVVFASSAGIAGAEIGEFTNKSFEATLESGKAVLKVPVADFGGSALTTSDTPVALVRNTTKTTGIISCTVIEE